MKALIKSLTLVSASLLLVLLQGCATTPMQTSFSEPSMDMAPELQLVADSSSNWESSVTNTLAIKRSSSQGSSNVELDSVNVNRTFHLRAITESEFDAPTPRTMPAASKVQIVGSYYPKGIYREPANYSSLMMRAAPGEVFEVEYLANNWYKIMTNDGIGFLRADDGKVVSL